MPQENRSGRIGLLVPSSNTTVEPEFYRALPESVTLHTARLFLTRIAPESIAGMVEELERASRLLATADVDVILLGATAPSFLKGLGYDRELIARIAAATGKHATTTSTAMIEALRHLGLRRLALGSAYDDKVNRIAADFLEANGFEVVALQGLGYVDNLEVGRLPAETAYRLGREVDHAQAEAVLLACTNWRTMPIVERLERDLGKPVVTTTQASLCAALRILGSVDALPGYGRLLRTIPTDSETN